MSQPKSGYSVNMNTHILVSTIIARLRKRLQQCRSSMYCVRVGALLPAAAAAIRVHLLGAISARDAGGGLWGGANRVLTPWVSAWRSARPPALRSCGSIPAVLPRGGTSGRSPRHSEAGGPACPVRHCAFLDNLNLQLDPYFDDKSAALVAEVVRRLAQGGYGCGPTSH